MVLKTKRKHTKSTRNKNSTRGIKKRKTKQRKTRKYKAQKHRRRNYKFEGGENKTNGIPFQLEKDPEKSRKIRRTLIYNNAKKISNLEYIDKLNIFTLHINGFLTTYIKLIKYSCEKPIEVSTNVKKFLIQHLCSEESSTIKKKTTKNFKRTKNLKNFNMNSLNFYKTETDCIPNKKFVLTEFMSKPYSKIGNRNMTENLKDLLKTYSRDDQTGSMLHSSFTNIINKDNYFHEVFGINGIIYLLSITLVSFQLLIAEIHKTLESAINIDDDDININVEQIYENSYEKHNNQMFECTENLYKVYNNFVLIHYLLLESRIQDKFDEKYTDAYHTLLLYINHIISNDIILYVPFNDTNVIKKDYITNKILNFNFGKIKESIKESLKLLNNNTDCESAAQTTLLNRPKPPPPQ